MTVNLFFNRSVLLILLFYSVFPLHAFNVDAGEDQIISNGNVVEVEIGGSPTASGSTVPSYTYLWEPAEGLSCNNCTDPTIIPNPTASPTKTTTYTVTVIDGGGFVCTDDVEVAVISLVVHPKASDFVSGYEGRVLISTFHDASYYTNTPTTMNNLTAQHESFELANGKCNRVKITAHLSPGTGAVGQTVYFRLVKPDLDDPSPYETVGTSTSPDLNSLDNRHTGLMEGELNGVKGVVSAVASLRVINGKTVAAAEVELTITDKHAGDNYQVEAALDPNFTIGFDKTSILTAWKRIYVRLGGMLENSTVVTMPFTADSETLLDDDISITPSSVFKTGDVIDIFFPDPNNGYAINSITRKIINIQFNVLTVADMPHDLPVYAGVKISGSTNIYKPISFNSVNINGLEKAFGKNTDGVDGGCFTEFKLSAKPIFEVPKVEYLFTGALRMHYMSMWHDAVPYDATNELLLISAYNSDNNTLGLGATSTNTSMIYNDAISYQQNLYSFTSPTDFTNAISEITAHEFGHHFDPTFSYIDKIPTNPADLNHEGNDFGIMTYVLYPGSTYISQLFNTTTEFKKQTIYHIRDENGPK